MNKLLGIILCFGCASAWASPVQWTLNNVTFADGKTLQGTFTYDADTGQYSNVLMSASDLPWILYSDTYQGPFHVLNEANGSATNLYAKTRYDSYPVTILNLYFDTALTNAGGVVSFLASSNESTYGNLSQPPLATRYIVSGNVSAVPLPAAVWLFASALAGLGWTRHRRGSGIENDKSTEDLGSGKTAW